MALYKDTDEIPNDSIKEREKEQVSSNGFLETLNDDCILIEIDNKGYYHRFALTPMEFESRYRRPRPDIPPAIEVGDTYTLSPLVHMWYMLTGVGSEDWCNFFTDMTWGLAQSDIDNDNIAKVAPEEFGALKDAWAEFDKGL